MPASSEPEVIAALFSALGDPTRLQLIARLGAEGPLPIMRLSDGTGMTRQALTKHLNVLKAAGLVSDERIGRLSLWTAEPIRLHEAQYHLEALSARWDLALGRLRQMVED